MRSLHQTLYELAGTGNEKKDTFPGITTVGGLIPVLSFEDAIAGTLETKF